MIVIRPININGHGYKNKDVGIINKTNQKMKKKKKKIRRRTRMQMNQMMKLLY